MAKIQDEVAEIEARIQELEDVLEAISSNHVMFPALFLELQELKDLIRPLKDTVIKHNL